jgi:type I restriction enzyme M protein
LLGGIPERDINDLARYWDLFPGLRGRLFAANSRPGYSELRVAAGEIKPTIFADPEFVAYMQLVKGVFAGWQADVLPRLRDLAAGTRPKQVIEDLSEELLRAFGKVSLIDKYDIYQHVMTYWAETMQDDVYLIAADGWQANAELVPAPLVIERYFAAEQEAIVTLEAETEAIGRQMEELDEEHGSEGGLLEGAKNENGKITKAAINARVREIFDDPEAADELAVLARYLALLDQDTEVSRRVRLAQKALDARVAAKYKVLSEDEIKILVVDDKWLAAMAADVQTELDRVSQALTGRVRELAERYATPLPQLTDEIATLSGRVEKHLKRMGF